MRLQGKNAIITGAASGLGAGIAAAFIREGANVLLTDVNDSKGAMLAAELSPNAEYLHLDVTSEEEWGRCVEHFSSLDIVVNNAGISLLGSIEEVTKETFRSIYDVDVLGVLLGCRFAISAMKKNGSGSIINLASSTAVKPEPEMPVYCSAKAAVTSVSKSVALHCARNGYGIRVNTILPGLIQTDMLDYVLGQVPADKREEAMDRWKSKFPIGRLGRIEEVAAAAVYLASDSEAGFTTGLDLLVDGGSGI